MRIPPLYVLLLLLTWAMAANAQTPPADVAVGAEAETPAMGSPSASPAERESELTNQILALFSEAVITRLDARVSLESLKVEDGRLRLTGVLLKNLNVGLRLNAKATQRLAQALQRRYEQPQSNSKRQWTQLLEVLKLGIFNQLEINVHLDELRVRRIALDAEGLKVEGLLLQVGATPPDPVTGKPRSDTLQTLMDILRRTALDRIQAHAGLDALNARRLHLDIDGLALRGFSFGVVLARQDYAASPAGE